MKNIIKILVLVFIVTACTKDKQKSYVTFSGKIENNIYDSIVLQKLYRNNKKVIKLSKDGTFKDTLTVQNSFYKVYMGNHSEKVYLKNGDHIVMNIDLDNYKESLKFSGKGAAETNLVKKYNHTMKSLQKNGLINSSNKDFETQTSDYISKYNNLLEDENLDSTFVVIQRGIMHNHLKNIIKEFESVQYIKNNLGKGTPSPKFVDYTNYNGTTTSLDDLKGKYVYIDFWSTYCPPCIREFPALEGLIEKYDPKKIEFVSISLNSADEFEEWKNFVTKKELKGIQLIIGNNNFRDAYSVNGIPRYALIDPDGNIIDADTFKPSDRKLVGLLDSLEI